MQRQADLLKSWNVLRAQWQAANQDAAEARASVMRTYEKGALPSPEQLDDIRRLERVAARLAVDMDTFVKNCLTAK